MQENENLEFKKEFTENIYKEIIAFLNTSSGTILVGYNDDGILEGLDNAKEIEEKISNGIKTKIYPDPSIFVSVNSSSMEGKDFIIVKVSKGIDVYYLKEKGIMKGTYLRTGSCSIPGSEETIKQLIMRSNNISFETAISTNQTLTFKYIKPAFDEINIEINDKNIQKNLGLISNNNFTNLALLLSDQNPFTFKVAVYPNEEKENFLDRKEYSGSILEIYDKVLDYLKLNSATYGFIESTIRKDVEEFPEFVLREIVLNSLIHRDYSSVTSNIINIYRGSGIELINYGSLFGNITLEDILAGLSTTRNPKLQAIFMRLKRVEAIGSGLRRVNTYYKNIGLEMNISVLPSSFLVFLPSISNIQSSNDEVSIIINYIKINGSITRKETENIIEKEKTSAATILNKMLEDGILKKEGNGPSTKYILK